MFFRSYKAERKFQWSEVHVSAECEFCETEVNFCSLEVLVLLNSDVCCRPEEHVSMSKRDCNDIFCEIFLMLSFLRSQSNLINFIIGAFVMNDTEDWNLRHKISSLSLNFLFFFKLQFLLSVKLHNFFPIMTVSLI